MTTHFAPPNPVTTKQRNWASRNRKWGKLETCLRDYLRQHEPSPVLSGALGLAIVIVLAWVMGRNW